MAANLDLEMSEKDQSECESFTFIPGKEQCDDVASAAVLKKDLELDLDLDLDMPEESCVKPETEKEPNEENSVTELIQDELLKETSATLLTEKEPQEECSTVPTSLSEKESQEKKEEVSSTIENEPEKESPDSEKTEKESEKEESETPQTQTDNDNDSENKEFYNSLLSVRFQEGRNKRRPFTSNIKPDPAGTADIVVQSSFVEESPQEVEDVQTEIMETEIIASSEEAETLRNRRNLPVSSFRSMLVTNVDETPRSKLMGLISRVFDYMDIILWLLAAICLVIYFKSSCPVEPPVTDVIAPESPVAKLLK